MNAPTSGAFGHYVTWQRRADLLLLSVRELDSGGDWFRTRIHPVA
jgi:hypothetical protein